MNVLFFKIGNLIIQREQICSSEYRDFDSEDAKLLGAEKILYLKMTDGSQIKLRDDDAKEVWELLKLAALDITPVKADVANS